MKVSKVVFLASAALLVSFNAVGQQEGPDAGEKPYFSDPVATSKSKLQSAVKGYAQSLRSENEGVIESSLAHIAFLWLHNANSDFTEARLQAENVATSHSSQQVRYKAYLVNELLQNRPLFSDIALLYCKTPDDLFEELATRMQKMIAGNIIEQE